MTNPEEDGVPENGVATLKHFFRPRSIAVIGASHDRETVGGNLFRNITDADFNGPVYPVNKNATFVQSIAAYKSVLDCPGPVDLAYIAVPAKAVIGAAKECVQKGVRALVIISSGFAETGKEGATLQEELMKFCKESGVRMIGPNCMGIINTDPRIRLNGQIAGYRVMPGKIGFWSQSGALGIAVIDLANKLGIGVAEFVSAGNRADVSGNDVVEYWEDNENVGIILLYIEWFGDPRRFARLAKRITKRKPIVAVKSGRSTAGFRATQSHTGALVAASDVTVDALFKQCGVIRTDSLEEMFDVAALLTTQPVPMGNGVAIITNAGGAGILATDACESTGLEVPELSEETQGKLRKFLLPIASTKNPVDMTGSATATDYGNAIRAVADDPEIDSLMVIFIPPLPERPAEVASEMLRAAKEIKRKLPIISTFMASKGVTTQLSDGVVSIPTYPFPEVAAQSLAKATDYGKWLNKPHSAQPNFTVEKVEAAAVVSAAVANREEWLSASSTEALLKCYGISTAKFLQAENPQEAELAAARFSGKVALKVTGPGLLHKTNVGGVKVGLEPSAVRSAAEEMATRLRQNNITTSGFMIQEMVSGGVEMFVGITNDPLFGPLIACGAGGTLVEMIRDVSVRLTPLTEADAEEMVHSLKTYQLLEGYRDGPRYDVKALQDVVLRLGQMVEEIPEVAELDLNPLIVLQDGSGAVVVDARVRVMGSLAPATQPSK